MAYACLGLACLATDLGDWHRARLLHGVAQCFLDPTAEAWQDPETRYRRGSLGQRRARLGDEHADRAYAEGTAISLDQALDLAIGTADTALAFLSLRRFRSAAAAFAETTPHNSQI